MHRRWLAVARVLIPTLLIAAGLLLLARTRELDAANRVLEAHCPLRYCEALVRAPVAGAFGEELPFQFTVQPGETLGQVLSALGLSYDDSRAVTEALAEHVEPRRLRAGTPYTAYFDREADLAAFELPLNGQGRLTVRRAEAGWSSTWREFHREVRLRAVHGVLEGSLIGTLERAGASPKVAYLMADALQWDLDFTRDLRLGDEFRVLYDEVFLDGRSRGAGELHALHYTNRGETLKAYRYGTDGAFYDSEGRPLRKMFLRSPLKFSRVTSRFSHRRFHPILKTYRPHYGVDYGAPTGTPVHATGSGVVSFAGWNKGAGRMVRLRHPNQYETNYLHLSRFADGIRPGRRVSQGQVIGYVGSTGLSTAPHLDYRVKVKGRWINPLTIKSVPARPLSEEEKPRFLSIRDALRESLVNGHSPELSEPAPAFPSTEPAPPLHTARVTPPGGPVGTGNRLSGR